MLEIREAVSDDDLGHMVAIIGRVSPEDPYVQGPVMPARVPA